jgi:hypothetical protein
MSEKPWIPDDALTGLVSERSLHPEEDEVALAQRLFRENTPAAAASIIHSAIHSPSERVRLDASKYVLERTMGPVGETNVEISPTEDFISKVIDYVHSES